MFHLLLQSGEDSFERAFARQVVGQAQQSLTLVAHRLGDVTRLPPILVEGGVGLLCSRLRGSATMNPEVGSRLSVFGPII